MIEVWSSKGEVSPQGGSNQSLPNITVKPIVHVLLAHNISAKIGVITETATLTTGADKPLRHKCEHQVSRGRVGAFGD